MLISIIICSVDEERFAAVTAMYHAALGSHPHEIIGIHDARSLAEGYMRGVGKSTGEIIVLSHDDIEVLSDDLAGKLHKHLASHDMVGIAGTSRLIDGMWIAAGPPHLFGHVLHLHEEGTLVVDIFGAPRAVVGNIQALDGVFIATRREVFSKIAFDPVTFDGFHQYDIDFTYAAFRAGLKLAVACDICLLHASLGWIDDEFQKYADRFRRKWLPDAPAPQTKKFRWTWIKVESRAEALQIMNPPHWNWPTDG